MKKLFLLLIVLSFSVTIFAQSDPTIEQTAMKYISAYGKWDFDAMKELFADNIHFEDPTGTDAFGQSFVFDGKENVYAFFKNVFKDKFANSRPPYVNFNVEKKFVSGPFVVVNSTFECIIPTSWFKADSTETILISVPFTTILKVENGLITEHTDYGDYAKYNQQISAQLK